MARGTNLTNFKNADGSQRGPHGFCLCRVCGMEVDAADKTLCSAACIKVFRAQTDFEYLKKLVFERDQGCCALCGLDTEKLLAERTARLLTEGYDGKSAEFHAAKIVLAEWGLLVTRRLVLWDCDHIRPVVLEGDNSLENTRTLCLPCHKQETKQLMKAMRGSGMLKRMRRAKFPK